MTKPNHTAAAAVADSILADLNALIGQITESKTELTNGNTKGAVGAAMMAEGTVERVTSLYPALMTLLRQSNA